jgi:hypothetical protein
MLRRYPLPLFSLSTHSLPPSLRSPSPFLLRPSIKAPFFCQHTHIILIRGQVCASRPHTSPKHAFTHTQNHTQPCTLKLATHTHARADHHHDQPCSLTNPSPLQSPLQSPPLPSSKQPLIPMEDCKL